MLHDIFSIWLWLFKVDDCQDCHVARDVHHGTRGVVGDC